MENNEDNEDFLDFVTKVNEYLKFFFVTHVSLLRTRLTLIIRTPANLATIKSTGVAAKEALYGSQEQREFI